MTKNIRRIATTLGASAVAVIATFALAGPASAATLKIWTTDDNPGGSLQWTAYGDKVTVCDTQADNYFAEGDVYNSKGIFVYSVIASGNGTCKSESASNGAPYDLTEGAKYTLDVCIMEDFGYPKFCSSATVTNNN